MNCWPNPSGMEGESGVSAIDVRTAAVTVISRVSVIDPRVAVMVEVPVPAVVRRPSEPEALLTAATPVSAEVHVTVAVRSWGLPSE